MTKLGTIGRICVMHRTYIEASVSHTIFRTTDLTLRQRNILTREIVDSLEYLLNLEQKGRDCKDDREWDVAENIGERMKGDGTW